MNAISELVHSANGSYRHVARLLDKGLTPPEIELYYLDVEFKSRTPRKKYRLLELYKSVYRNLLIFNRYNPSHRKFIKSQFYSDWTRLNLPFNDSMIDSAWENISQQVLTMDNIEY
jgi:hypothetical protein